MKNTLLLDDELIARYDQSGPRYTSYPTALQFADDFTLDDYKAAAERSNVGTKPLSLYFHIPFCDTLCFYCACNKIATKDRSKADEYLIRLHKEIEMQAALFDSSRPVEQLHWGGGTPTFLNIDQMRELMAVTGRHFNLLDNDRGEYSIEIDPREVGKDAVDALREIGFNRMSIGLQDLDIKVQKAVNRIQSAEETFGVLKHARDAGFRSVSLDLIYGLPHQTLDSFSKTLDRVIEESPDRLSVFNYAHMPTRFMPQRRINEEDLPAPSEKLDILHMVGEKLSAAGYTYIGMDHFAKPDDEIAKAQEEGNLYRNFQGYSTHAHCDLISIGVTSIGIVDNVYSQNVRTTEDYYEAIDNGRLPVMRGVELNRDDELRRELITQLICNFQLDKKAFAEKWDIDFDEYFAESLPRLAPMIEDELVEISDSHIQVMPAGRLLIRNVCMVFDAYLKHDDAEKRYSRVI